MAKNYGLEYVLATAVMAGLIQIAFEVLKLGKFIRLVPQPAIYDFVNGLAIVIAMSDEGAVMYAPMTLTMAIMFFLPKLTKTVPAGLVAIVIITLIVVFGDLPTKQVG